MFILEANNGMGTYTRDDYEAASSLAPSSMAFASDDAYRSFQNVCRVHGGDIGGFAITFAINWARLMEGEINKGNELSQEIINNCLSLAMFSVENPDVLSCSWARNLLIVHWKYGEKLMTDSHKKIYGCKPDMTKFYMTDAAVNLLHCSTMAS